MKIVFTGGGTGGHFYPIIAIAQKVRQIARAEKLVDVKMYYLSDSPYDARMLFENHVEYRKVAAGKMRRYFSVKNIFDTAKTAAGILRGIWQMYLLFPDVVFGKGGYASVPTLFAARLLRIPVVIHESDSVAGRANLWASRFAKIIAVAYPEAEKFFPKERVVITGLPIRSELLLPVSVGARELLGAKDAAPIIFIVGGSQGAERINDAVLDVISDLVGKYTIVHQTGEANFISVRDRAAVILRGHENKHRYIPLAHVDESHMRAVASSASLVITRGGSMLFEIGQWGIPAIVIPIPETISRDQRTNAFTYARGGGAIVLEEANLTPHVLLSEIARILENPSMTEEMKRAARAFSKPDAAEKIARILIGFGLEHEPR